MLPARGPSSSDSRSAVAPTNSKRVTLRTIIDGAAFAFCLIGAAEIVGYVEAFGFVTCYAWSAAVGYATALIAQ